MLVTFQEVVNKIANVNSCVRKEKKERSLAKSNSYLNELEYDIIRKEDITGIQSLRIPLRQLLIVGDNWIVTLV